MLGGTIQEPCIQKVDLGFLLKDPTKNPTLALRLLMMKTAVKRLTP
jgi:hypothetical protein